MYVVKMDGMKVRSDFNDYNKACEWAEAHCKSAPWEVVGMIECKGLPRACKPIHPNLDMPKLVYRPFVSLT